MRFRLGNQVIEGDSLETEFADLRSMTRNQAIETISRLVSQSESDALFLVGHGNPDGDEFLGLDAEGILSCVGSQSLIWLHACYCGRSLIPDLSSLGPRSVGFVDKVPYEGDRDPTVAEGLVTLRCLPGDVKCEELLSCLRGAWLRLAVDFLDRGDVFRAAIVGYVSLISRCSESGD